MAGNGISVFDCGPNGCTLRPNPNFRRRNTMIQTILKRFVVGACIVAVSMIAIGNSAFAVDLTVYTAVEAEDLKKICRHV